jgi:lipid A 3-O-deacylase
MSAACDARGTAQVHESRWTDNLPAERDTRFERGETALGRLNPDVLAQEEGWDLAEIYAPRLDWVSIAYLYGDLQHRKGLDNKTRWLAIVYVVQVQTFLSEAGGYGDTAGKGSSSQDAACRGAGRVRCFRRPSDVPHSLSTIHKMKLVEHTLVCAAGLLLAAWHAPMHAADSVSAEFATGNQTKAVRLGAQWKWKQQWWRSNGTHLGGYWDLSVARWRGTQFQDQPSAHQIMWGVGITPTFRLQSDSLKGLYGEAGIGIHYLSDHYDNCGRQLSTRFQFGDHVGIGYVFRNDFDLGLRIRHFSNGSIKQPNDGVNFVSVRLSFPFD